MTVINRPAVRRVASSATVVALLATTAACGNSDDASAKPNTPTTTAAPAADTIALTVSGGLNATVNSFLIDPKRPMFDPECRWYQNEGVNSDSYTYKFAGNVAVGGDRYSFTIGHNSTKPGKQTYPVIPLGHPARYTSIDFFLNNGTINNNRWGTGLVNNDAEVTGTVIFNEDHSGSIDATLSRSKGKPGGPLKIKASWTCAKIQGKK